MKRVIAWCLGLLTLVLAHLISSVIYARLTEKPATQMGYGANTGTAVSGTANKFISSTGSITLSATSSGCVTLSVPQASGQVLTTNGSGTVVWGDAK
jgi:peptidoglycan biosynthesis protein MviN/MurJ (putative lipid II flippase)